MNPIPNIELNDGHTIPQLGYGTHLVPPEHTAETVLRALQIGYRHIDTAEMYDNEQGVGEAFRRSGLERSDVFITSKLSNAAHRPADARAAFDGTLRALGLDFVDLFLIHWPLPTLYDGDYISTWQVLEDIQRDGLARSIGVSNFEPSHLERLAAETNAVPAVNQIEAHPYFPNETVRAYGAQHGIITQAWSPLAKGRVLPDPTVARIATRLGRTPAQIVLRWHIERGDVVFPKTMAPDRMQQNLELFDFALEPSDHAMLAGLDQRDAGRDGPHPDTFDWMP